MADSPDQTTQRSVIMIRKLHDDTYLTIDQDQDLDDDNLSNQSINDPDD